MIVGRLEGGDELVRRLQALPPVIRRALLNVVARLTIELQAYVMEHKLSGQVLHNRTGTLRRSIFQYLTAQGTVILGNVGTKLKYGIHWETGGTIPAHDVVPRNKKALAFQWKGRQWALAKVHIPARTDAARSFLASALADKAGYIREQIELAIQNAVRSTMRGGA